MIYAQWKLVLTSAFHSPLARWTNLYGPHGRGALLSPSQIAAGLASLTPGGANGGEFAVLGRSDQVYVQAAIAPGSGSAGSAVTFLLEYREGGAALHFQSEQPQSLEQTVTLFQAYAAGGAEWNASVQWKKI